MSHTFTNHWWTPEEKSQSKAAICMRRLLAERRGRVTEDVYPPRVRRRGGGRKAHA